MLEAFPWSLVLLVFAMHVLWALLRLPMVCQAAQLACLARISQAQVPLLAHSAVLEAFPWSLVLLLVVFAMHVLWAPLQQHTA